MSWSRRELVALIVLVMLHHLVAAGSDGNASGSVSGSVTSPEQQLELKLSALRVHRQLLQSEIARLYMENFRPETPLLLEELQQRQQEVQLQIETLEGKAQHEQDAQQLAIHLAADFEYLQHKLDELKQQLQQLDATMSQGNHTAAKLPPGEAQRDDTPTTPTAVSSYFWTPLLAMPEFPSGSIAQSAAASNATPSLIKRLLAMLRPSASSSTSTFSSASLSFLRGQSSKPQQKVQLLSAEELLPQLQLQRQFLDDAITRLEQLAAGKKSDKNP
ncbi:uncharacterized protein LOC133849093 [Drosophila sulfurigaster albostrigata]|uniref:uncharacterized protein LOC133849093 n=1 Tax=Drosophila sulfurigaster albostrigata TaxID=89887 RepID=UPI002D21DAD4|nr:uncharacterized protein LOC133849093 [Drosophila sulfurigaster albostrigata]